MVSMTISKRILSVTVVATFWLILLGIYTAAIGAGLTCDARWPLCDGAVFGLFPANWTSFVEWFHRLIAMVTGLMILGSWWIVWRSETRPAATWAISIAVALLPVQIWLGAETVVRYELFVLTAHFLTALIIFGALISALWWYREYALSSMERTRLLGLVLGLVLPFVLLTPHFLFVHSGRVQVLYYGIGLIMFAGLLIIGLDSLTGDPQNALAIGSVAGIGIVSLAVQFLAGRLIRSPTVHTADWIAAGLLVLVLLFGLWRYREDLTSIRLTA